MKLRILESQWAPFVNSLCTRRDVETAGIILAERLQGDLLLAKELLMVPDSGYAVRRIDQLRIDPVAFNRLIRPARDKGLSILTVHTHPGSTEPWFSRADDLGDARLMPSLFTQMSGPHGSMVIAGDTGIATARVWLENGVKTSVDLQIIGKVPHFSTNIGSAGGPAPWFDRQQLALGQNGQAILRNLNVAVIGLGGTGSVAFAQLAHLGVGHITVVDGDLVESSNVSRIIGATAHDVAVSWKVDVAARYAQTLGLGTSVTVLRGHLGADIDNSALEGCDIILSCVDRHIPRAILNRLAYAKAIPIIDMGTAFRVDSVGKIVAGAGRVVIVGPGRRCLACWGHIDSARMRIESLPPSERAKEAAEGYVSGVDIPQPSVMAFNTMVAGAAVTELLRLATHFAGVDEPPSRLGFDFLSGTVKRNILGSSDACSICSSRATRDATLNPNDAEDALIYSGKNITRKHK